ncbi:trypco2 family protein [Streptomyces sp. NPDC048277]|uniref:trypco2 family protein n=1 Tax=Streptomyces sp. NPDC048277 TaxID=3155027 RepID=UPI0033D618BD
MGDAGGSGVEGLDLADAITLLRSQVAQAQARIAGANGEDQGVLFSLGDITVELGMELTHTRGMDGGLRFGVVSLGGRKDSARKATHTVTVHLRPHRPGGGDIDVSDEE